MGIKLKPHQIKAYKKLDEMIKEKGIASLIMATGTGKSFIILKWLEEHPEEKALIITSRDSIIEQFISKAKALNIDTSALEKIVTYSDFYYTEDEELPEGITTLILDEFHRAGAPKWGAKLKDYIDKHPDIKRIGTSATPIRYYDGYRDMADELFDGNIAYELSLAEAIAEDILPMPEYIIGMYSFNNDLNRLQEKINELSNESERAKHQTKLDEAKRLLENSKGLPELFQKNLKYKDGKYLVFCSNIEQMNRMVEESKKWFANVNPSMSISTISYENTKLEAARILKDFEERGNDGSLHLLFSIDKLTEGVHIKGVDGIIMTRKTDSPWVYRQTIGRALEVEGSSHPQIFDLVDNVDNDKEVYDLYNDVKGAMKKKGRTDTEIAHKIAGFEIKDEIKDFKNIISSVDSGLTFTWEDFYKLAKKYYEKNGNSNIPYNCVMKKQNIGIWWANQKQQYLMLKQKEEEIDGYKMSEKHRKRFEKLEQIGWVLNIRDNIWNMYCQIAEKFFEKYGDINVPKEFDCTKLNLPTYLLDVAENFDLNAWVQTQIHTISARQYETEGEKEDKQERVNWEERIPRLAEMGIVPRQKKEKPAPLSDKIPKNLHRDTLRAIREIGEDEFIRQYKNGEILFEGSILHGIRSQGLKANKFIPYNFGDMTLEQVQGYAVLADKIFGGKGYFDVTELKSILSILTNTERDIIIARNGLDDGKIKTLYEIAEIYDKNRERIRQIEHKALTKLKYPSCIDKFGKEIAPIYKQLEVGYRKINEPKRFSKLGIDMPVEELADAESMQRFEDKKYVRDWIGTTVDESDYRYKWYKSDIVRKLKELGIELNKKGKFVQVMTPEEVIIKNEQEAEKRIRESRENDSHIEKYEHEQYSGISITEMDLSARAFNCLKRAGKCQVSNLVGMTENDFMKIRNLGRISYEEIIAKLADEYGVEFDENGVLISTREETVVETRVVEKEIPKELEKQIKKGPDINITEMNLSARSFNCLDRARKNQISDLVGMTENDFMKIRNLGIRSYEEIIAKLADEYGVEFDENGVLISTREEPEVIEEIEQEEVPKPEVVEIIEEEPKEPIDIFKVEREEIAKLEAIVADYEQKKKEWLGDTIFLEDTRLKSDHEGPLQDKMREKLQLGFQLAEVTGYANEVKKTFEEMLGEKANEDI